MYNLNNKVAEATNMSVDPPPDMLGNMGTDHIQNASNIT